MNALDKMTQIVEQTGDKVIDQQGAIFSKKIKQYASDFLKIITKDEKELEQIEKGLRRQENIIKSIQQADSNAVYQWKIQIQNRHYMTKKDFYKEMVTAALKFQNQLNELLNQKVELIYIYQDENNNPVLYTLDEASLTSALIYQRSKDRISGRFKETKNFMEHLNNLTKYELYEKFNIEYFNYTYKQVIWRFNYGRQKGTGLIMWLNPNFGNNKTKWLKARVGQQGDIKEAYASVILDRGINSIKLFNDDRLDNNVHSFMEQIAKVDNESGLLKGDITVDQIEYAIKGSSASTLGLKQIVAMAETIINKTNYIKQDLQKQKEDFHRMAQTRNNIQRMGIKTFHRWQKKLGQTIQAKNNISMKTLIKYQPSDISSIFN